jgi:hypothetical protein
MRYELISPEIFDLPDHRRNALRRIVIAEIRTAAPVGFARLRTVPAAVGMSVLLLAIAGVAGAALLRSGIEFDHTRAVLPAERAEVIDRLGSDIPLPPGGSFAALVNVDYVEDEDGLAGSLAFNAWCQWTGWWLDGALDEDPTKQQEALTIMEEVPQWPELLRVDSPVGGVTPALAQIAASASGNDVETVATHYQINCTGLDQARDDRLGAIWPPLPPWDQGPGEDATLTEPDDDYSPGEP